MVGGTSHHSTAGGIISLLVWQLTRCGIAPTVWPAWNFDWLRMRLETLILEEKYWGARGHGTPVHSGGFVVREEEPPGETGICIGMSSRRHQGGHQPACKVCPQSLPVFGFTFIDKMQFSGESHFAIRNFNNISFLQGGWVQQRNINNKMIHLLPPQFPDYWLLVLTFPFGPDVLCGESTWCTPHSSPTPPQPTPVGRKPAGSSSTTAGRHFMEVFKYRNT